MITHNEDIAQLADRIIKLKTESCVKTMMNNNKKAINKLTLSTLKIKQKHFLCLSLSFLLLL